MENNIKKWYQEEFPEDYAGEELNDSATFEGLKDNLPNVYDYVGTDESDVREMLFNELAYRMGVSYSAVYNKWLYG